MDLVPFDLLFTLKWPVIYWHNLSARYFQIIGISQSEDYDLNGAGSRVSKARISTIDGSCSGFSPFTVWYLKDKVILCTFYHAGWCGSQYRYDY